MMFPGKVTVVSIPLVFAFIWPFTGTETVMVLTSVASTAVAIIAALKAHDAKVAVNGHLLKLENEQEKAKQARDAEFDRLLQVVKDASRAEGEEIARKAAELLAAKVAEAVIQERAKGLPPAPMAPAPAQSVKPATRMGEAIVTLTAAAEETSELADKTVDLARKHPR